MTPKVYAPVKTGKKNYQVEVPIKVQDFNSINAVQLRLEYDNTVLTYVKAKFTPTMIEASKPQIGNPVYGGIPQIRIAWSSVKPLTLKKNQVLVYLVFKCSKTAGETLLKWNNESAGGHDCEFAVASIPPVALADSPENFINGKITVV